MSKGSPSMVALLGLLAVAGYQNRDRLSGLLQTASNPNGNPRSGSAPDDLSGTQPNGSVVDSLRQMLTSVGGGGLAGGLAELLGRFANPVQAAKVNSWVDTGPNGALAAGDLDDVLDDDTVADLMEKTGLARADLMARLSAILPDAVDQLTPNGQLPTPQEAVDLYEGRRT